MPKIIDPDLLNQGVEVTLNKVSRTITLNKSGNLSDDGVSLQCLYSFLKEEWRNDNTLIPLPFPILSITDEQFEIQNGWDFGDTTSKQLIRDGGWALRSTGNTINEMFMNLTTLGSFNNANSDRSYYLQVNTSSGTPINTVYTGPVNQAIKIFGNTGFGNFDYRNFFKIFLRVQGKTYDSYDLLTLQNITQLTYKKYALPLSNSIDTKITIPDSTISGSTPYTSMSITFYGTNQVRNIGGVNYNFNKIINGANATAEQIYNYVQYQLRRSIDIDSGVGVNNGNIADSLLEFVGDTLRTKTGVYIDNFNIADRNRLQFTDVSGITRTFPFVSTGTINFNSNLTNDSNGKYWMFFQNAGGNQFGTTNAIIVNDNNGVPITGSTSGLTSVSFTFDYDNNIQGGRTSGVDAPVVLVAIGLNSAQYVNVDSTITRSTQNSISVVSNIERNYSNT
jgi:hypothetical protein